MKTHTSQDIGVNKNKPHNPLERPALHKHELSCPLCSSSLDLFQINEHGDMFSMCKSLSCNYPFDLVKDKFEKCIHSNPNLKYNNAETEILDNYNSYLSKNNQVDKFHRLSSIKIDSEEINKLENNTPALLHSYSKEADLEPIEAPSMKDSGHFDSRANAQASANEKQPNSSAASEMSLDIESFNIPLCQDFSFEPNSLGYNCLPPKTQHQDVSIKAEASENKDQDKIYKDFMEYIGMDYPSLNLQIPQQE